MRTEITPSDIAGLNSRTLMHRLEEKYDRTTKLDILRKMSMTINRSYSTLSSRGIDTSFTDFYERHAVFKMGTSGDKLYRNASDEVLNDAIMKAQKMMNMQTRTKKGEMDRRKHSIEALFNKLTKGAGSSKDMMRFKKALGFQPRSGRYADRFFQLLSRATDSIHNASVYYHDGRGGVMGALVREMNEKGLTAGDLDNVDWNDIIRDVEDKLQTQIDTRYEDDDDPERAFDY